MNIKSNAFIPIFFIYFNSDEMFWFQNITKHPCFVIRITCQPILKDPGLSVTVVLGFDVPDRTTEDGPCTKRNAISSVAF